MYLDAAEALCSTNTFKFYVDFMDSFSMFRALLPGELGRKGCATYDTASATLPHRLRLTVTFRRLG